MSFGEPDIIHTGDIYWNGSYPFIDYSTGGSIDGTIQAVDAILSAVTGKTIIIPGHGRPVSSQTELAEYHATLLDIRENVGRLKQEGRTRDETVAAQPTAAFDVKWGQFLIGPDFFTRLVYAGV